MTVKHIKRASLLIREIGNKTRFNSNSKVIFQFKSSFPLFRNSRHKSVKCRLRLEVFTFHFFKRGLQLLFFSHVFDSSAEILKEV